MGDVKGMDEAVLVGVHHGINVALTPTDNVLGAVYPSLDEANTGQNALERFGTPLM